MFNGTLIEDLFVVVKKAETSARPALPEAAQSHAPNSDPQRMDFDFPQDRRQQANSKSE